MCILVEGLVALFEVSRVGLAQLALVCVGAADSTWVASSLTLWRLPHWPWVVEGVL